MLRRYILYQRNIFFSLTERRKPTGKLTISNIKNPADRFKGSSPCCKKAAVSSASLKQSTKAPPVLQPLGVSLEKIYIFVSSFQHSMSGYKGMTPEGLPSKKKSRPKTQLPRKGKKMQDAADKEKAVRFSRFAGVQFSLGKETSCLISKV